MAGVLDGLYDPVLGETHRPEIFSNSVDRLVMPGADLHPGAAKNVREARAGLNPGAVPDGEPRRKPVRDLLPEVVGNVPMEGSAANHVEHLHAPADAEDRPIAALERRPRKGEFEAVPLFGNVVGGFVRPGPVSPRVNVSAARED